MHGSAAENRSRDAPGGGSQSGSSGGPARASSSDEPPRPALDDLAQVIDPAVIRRMPILIVDDQPDNVRLVSALLSAAGYSNLHSSTDPAAVVALVADLRPGLLLLDLHMPGLDGFAVMRALAERATPGDYLPILILTADANPESRRRALASGANDFVAKPFDTAEVRLRVENLLRTQALHSALRRQIATLDEQVRARTEEIERSRLETLRALGLAAEYRDDETGRHTRRVGQLAAALGRTLGLAAEQIELLRGAAPLHDVGKIGIPDAILRKPGRLTEEEFAAMRAHVTIGHEILQPFQSALMRMARQITLTHHERWDGAGYPRGLAGEAIPLEGRIVAVADAFDVMTHDRSYQAARPVHEAVAEVIRQRGRQFDPAVADALVRIISDRHSRRPPETSKLGE